MALAFRGPLICLKSIRCRWRINELFESEAGPVRRVIPISAVVTLLMLFSTASGVDAAARFTLTPVPEGFLRFDSQNGDLSLCANRDGQIACKLLPDDRFEKSQEIERLLAESTQLRKQLDKLKSDSESGPSAKTEDGTVRGEDEFNRIVDAVERMINRVTDMVVRLKNRQPDEPKGTAPGSPG